MEIYIAHFLDEYKADYDHYLIRGRENTVFLM